MKKDIKPAIEQFQAECIQIMAISVIEGAKADDSEVLSKENVEWDMWEDE